MNFVQSFANVIFPEDIEKMDDETLDRCSSPVRFIADNCDRKTTAMLFSTGLPISFINDGNAGSMLCALKTAIKEGEDDEVIYFCEDDYLHLANAAKVLKEGLQHSDYVTLYDHPDKYTSIYDGGEKSKVIKTESSHWRFTVSTCMTFGTTTKTLKEDRDIWFSSLSESDCPRDHQIFSELKDKGRKLAVCIPGIACHTDLSFSGVINKVSIEPWCIEMMTEMLIEQMKADPAKQSMVDVMAKNKNGWEKLVSLHALFVS